MIRLDISQAIILYIFLSVIGLLLLWIYFEVFRKNKFKHDSKSYIWNCYICHYTYVDSIHDYMSVCPQCGSYNRREEAKYDN